MLSDDQIERYARHILLREVGGFGQERILGARVSLLGLGCLGGWAASYLALAGVGRLLLADDREVPEAGIVPIVPGGSRLRRDEALAAAFPAFNPDVSLEVVALEDPAIQLLAAGMGSGRDILWATLIGEGSGPASPGPAGFMALAAGSSALVGWTDAPCPRCLADFADSITETRSDPGIAALAGSLAASAILAAIIDPSTQKQGLRLVGAGEGSAPPNCMHRAAVG